MDQSGKVAIITGAANSLLRHKLPCGSDHPLPWPDRWIRDFEALDIRDEVRPLLLKRDDARALRMAA